MSRRSSSRTGVDATSAFALIDATVVMGDPSIVEEEEVVPGVSRPLRAVMRAGGQDIGVLIGRVPATRRWEPADQDLLELFASEMAAAIRNAQLFAQVETQNRQLLELDAAKDDFLRGVSHNLQTPLTSIRAYAEQLDVATPDRRLGIIAEQSERLSRMVRQLLTVTRLESGALRPRSEVVSLATRYARRGRRSASTMSTSRSRTRRRDGSQSPTRISSTRSCGPSSTTPSSTVPAPRSGQRSPWIVGRVGSG